MHVELVLLFARRRRVAAAKLNKRMKNANARKNVALALVLQTYRRRNSELKSLASA